MSKTAAELLRELDANATAGPWRIAGAREYPWILGPADYRGDDTFTIIGDDGYGVLSVPVCLTDGPHAGNSACFVSLRNALPLLAAVLDAADAMRDWTPVSYVPGLLPEPIEALRVEACATYDAASAALAEALKEGR